jgi:hypothetical protein
MISHSTLYSKISGETRMKALENTIADLSRKMDDALALVNKQ